MLVVAALVACVVAADSLPVTAPAAVPAPRLSRVARLALPATATVGESVKATATFRPVRHRRTVRLQRWAGDHWAVVARKRQDARGRAAFTLRHQRAGTFRYRAVIVRRGSDLRTPTRTIVVTAPVSSSGKHFVTGVSSNGRYFVDQTGRPVLVKGDSPWAILVDASTDQMDTYVSIRADQGFNAVLVSLLGNTSNGGPGNDGRTYDGVLPFVGGDPSKLNDAYWDRVEHFVARCRDAGITVMAYPLDGWTGTSAYDGLAKDWTVAQAKAYGEAVAARLSAYPNVIWALGGDYSGGDSYVNDRFAGALDGLAAGGMDRLSTIQLNYNMTSYDDPYWASRVDYDFVYSYAPTYTVMQSGYQQTATGGEHQPALMGETHYEAYPDVTNLYLRSQAAWALTSGAAGEFYGSEDVWDEAPQPSNLRTTAVAQLGALRAAFQRLPGWQRLVPDFGSDFITGGRGTKAAATGQYVSGNTYVTGAIAPDGTLAVVYLPDASRTITLDTTKMGSGYTARWIDPTTGASVAAGTGPTYSRSTKNAGNGPDWLLVLQSDNPR